MEVITFIFLMLLGIIAIVVIFWVLITVGVGILSQEDEESDEEDGMPTCRCDTPKPRRLGEFNYCAKCGWKL